MQEVVESRISCAEQEAIDVTLREEFVYDFFLYHAYSKLSGFLTNILGFAIFIMGVYSYWMGYSDGKELAFFVVSSVVFLTATPLQLKWKARQAMKQDMWRQTMHCTFFDGKGIQIERGENVRLYAWEEVERAAVAPKTIVLYIDGGEALVFPKESFGEKFGSIYQMIAINLGRSRSKRAEKAGKAKKKDDPDDKTAELAQ